MGDLYMIMLFTSARLSASLHYTCVQVFEGARICSAHEDWFPARAVFTTTNSSLSVIIDFVGDLISVPYRTILGEDTAVDEVRCAIR